MSNIPESLKALSINLLLPTLEEKINQLKSTVSSGKQHSPVQISYLASKLQQVLNQKQDALNGKVDFHIHQPLTSEILAKKPVSSTFVKSYGPKQIYSVQLQDSDVCIKIDTLTFEVEVNPPACKD